MEFSRLFGTVKFCFVGWRSCGFGVTKAQVVEDFLPVSDGNRYEQGQLALKQVLAMNLRRVLSPRDLTP